VDLPRPREERLAIYFKYGASTHAAIRRSGGWQMNGGYFGSAQYTPPITRLANAFKQDCKVDSIPI
jgi:hypothetical protein